MVDNICKYCRITAYGNEFVRRQGRVEKNGGKVWCRGERAEEESR